MSADELCHCKAHVDDEPMSHHIKADHKDDCSGSGPDVCGGCWGCIALTVYYWEARRGAADHADERSALIDAHHVLTSEDK